MILRPKNWTSFQHYKDRAPPWIRLYRSLLDDYEFQSLPVASRALAPMLWLIASEGKDGEIDANDKKLAFRLRMKVSELEDAIRPLISAEFFEVLRDASAALAERKQDAAPETEAERETEAETEQRQIARSASADEIAQAVEAYNLVAEKLDWPRAQVLSEARRKKLAGRLRECGGLQGWQAAMAKAHESSFLRGESGRDKAHMGWAPDLDFFIQQSSFTKLMEGKYDDRATRAEPAGFAAVVAGARAAVA